MGCFAGLQQNKRAVDEISKSCELQSGSLGQLQHDTWLIDGAGKLQMR